MRLVRGVAAVSLVLLAGCSHVSSAATHNALAPGRALPEDAFVAQYAYGSGDTGGGHGTFLSLFDEQSGSHLRDLVHVDEQASVRLGGYSRGSDRSITYALARGPYYTSDVANGAPRPGSCGGTVYRLDARTGLTRALFTLDGDRTVRSPASSPDGESVAYLSQPCTAQDAQQIVVRDLATGGERRVSVPGASVWRVAWSADGAQLGFTVGFQSEPSGLDAADYAVVAADTDGPQALSVLRRSPDPGCLVEAIAFDDAGVALIEGCPDEITASARLAQLVGTGPRVLWRADTGLCPNGMTLAYERAGRLLTTATTTCGGAGAPVDVVQLWTGQHPRELGRYVNPQQFVDAAT
jgi:hypothetical protein